VLAVSACNQMALRIGLIRLTFAMSSELFLENPDGFKLALGANLSLHSAFELLGASEAVKEQVQEKLDQGESVSKAEIRRLKLANESTTKRAEEAEKREREALRQKEEWRSQSLNERDLKRALELELITVKQSKKEIVYVDDSEQVAKELKTLLAQTKEKLKQAQNEKIEAIRATREKLTSGMDKEFARLQAQETALNSRLAVLQAQANAIENRVLHKEAHKTEQERFKKALIEQAVALMALEDHDVDESDSQIWNKLITDTTLMIEDAKLKLNTNGAHP